MSELNTDDQLLDHNYDGIQEYDNPLPTWWVTLFWISIVFAVFYAVYFHFGQGKLAVEAYNEDMVAFYELQAEQLLAMGEIQESTLLDLMGWPATTELEGRSLVASWQTDRFDFEPIYGETEYPRLAYGWASLRSLVTDRWKYVDAPKAELFDRHADPGLHG